MKTLASGVQVGVFKYSIHEGDDVQEFLDKMKQGINENFEGYQNYRIVRMTTNARTMKIAVFEPSLDEISHEPLHKWIKDTIDKSTMPVVFEGMCLVSDEEPKI